MIIDREDFEDAYEPNPQKSPFTQVKFDEVKQIYKPLDQHFTRVASALNSAWYGWRIRQPEIDRMKRKMKRLLNGYRKAKEEEFGTSQHNSRLFSTLLLVKDHFDMNDLDKSMPRVYEEIKETLEDKRCNKHNTSCTYQWELAFLNLQDTPELRKLYWSALGKIEFDRNDQIIPPVLEECPYCKEHQE